jgi:hypothetical protein
MICVFIKKEYASVVKNIETGSKALGIGNFIGFHI